MSNTGNHPGPRVRSRRKELGLLQQDLATAAGVTNPTISRLENGGAVSKLGTLSKIAARLGVTVGWLFGEDAQPHAPTATEVRVSAEWDGEWVRSKREERRTPTGVPVAGPGWKAMDIREPVSRDFTPQGVDLRVELVPGDCLVMAPVADRAPRHGDLVHAIIATGGPETPGRGGLYGYSDTGVSLLLPLVAGQQPEIYREPWLIVSVAVELRRTLGPAARPETP